MLIILLTGCYRYARICTHLVLVLHHTCSRQAPLSPPCPCLLRILGGGLSLRIPRLHFFCDLAARYARSRFHIVICFCYSPWSGKRPLVGVLFVWIRLDISIAFYFIPFLGILGQWGRQWSDFFGGVFFHLLYMCIMYNVQSYAGYSLLFLFMCPS